jgi:hypothetical protein
MPQRSCLLVDLIVVTSLQVGYCVIILPLSQPEPEVVSIIFQTGNGLPPFPERLTRVAARHLKLCGDP